MTIRTLESSLASTGSDAEYLNKASQLEELIYSTALGKMDSIDEKGTVSQRGKFLGALGNHLIEHIKAHGDADNSFSQYYSRGLSSPKVKIEASDIGKFLSKIGIVIKTLAEATDCLDKGLVDKQKFKDLYEQLGAEASIYSANGVLVFSLPGENSLAAVLQFFPNPDFTDFTLVSLNEQYISDVVLPFNGSIAEWIASGINFCGVREALSPSDGIIAYSAHDFSPL
jgi:hypothetical protein